MASSIPHRTIYPTKTLLHPYMLLPRHRYRVPNFNIPWKYEPCLAVSLSALFLLKITYVTWYNACSTTLGDSYLAPTLKLISLQSQALSSRPSDHKSWSALASQGTALRRGLIAGSQGLTAQVGFVDLEVSVGRLGPGDLKKVLQFSISFNCRSNEKNSTVRSVENFSRLLPEPRRYPSFNFIYLHLIYGLY